MRGAATRLAGIGNTPPPTDLALQRIFSGEYFASKWQVNSTK
jgi:hypothetical protein